MRRITIAAAVSLMLAGSTWGLELSDVVKQVEKSVVRVDTESSYGSGVVIHEMGIVLTSHHLVEGQSGTTVILRSGERLKTHGFIAVDPAHNLALIKTDKITSPLAIKMASDLRPKVGDPIVAFGNPKGFPLVTAPGRVSAIQSGSEMKDIMGPDSYRFLGCSPDTTWIQMTAAVSTGNTGGPLVNAKGELIGLNIWAHPQNSELNFAIGLAEIMRLMTLRQNPKPRVSSLVGARTPQDPRAKASVQKRELILPLKTERVFTYDVFQTPKVSRDSAERGDNVVLTYASGALYAAARHQKGKLHGPTAAQYESGAPMGYVAFHEGRRHGVLKTWTESGDPVLLSQYVNGRLDGFSCFHVDGKLALLIQYRADRPELVQMMAGNLPLESYVSREDAEKNPIARDLLQEMDEFDKKLKQNEYRFKGQVRDVELDRRRALAAKLAPQKRARIQQRANARSNANDAAIQSLYQKAYGR